jgi:mRNA interferase RelE/StbE
LTRGVTRRLNALPKVDSARATAKFDELAENPRPPGVKKLKGVGDTYRVRSGNFRIIYQIEDSKLIVLVIDLGNRRDVYRDL